MVFDQNDNKCNLYWLKITPSLWTDLVKMFYRKPRHASSFSFEHTDFKNIIFGKIHWAHSGDTKVAEVKRPRKWPLDLNDLGMGPVNFFKNYIFEISVFKGKRWSMSRLSRKIFSLNLSTAEGWASINKDCICYLSDQKPRLWKVKIYNKSFCFATLIIFICITKWPFISRF